MQATFMSYGEELDSLLRPFTDMWGMNSHGATETEAILDFGIHWAASSGKYLVPDSLETQYGGAYLSQVAWTASLPRNYIIISVLQN